ncbi:MAG: alpha-galactosidase [Acidobacteriaceae bacterium]|nr:alpha-galactosidase [Acidobacteriaceae bacterium]MBV9498388.1 alpha-galactosidase [Acidobacteriaceae bacterium]
MRSLPIGCCFALFFACAALAQIQYDASRKVWLITSSHSSYAMGIGPTGQLQHLYWGAPLWRIADVPAAQESHDISSFDPHQMLENEEFPGWGGPRYYEPGLKITRANGDRDLVLHYERHSIQENELEIALKDIRDDIEATLYYRVYPDSGIIGRWAVIRNGTNQPITLESAQSATWYMPRGVSYRLSYLSGRWAAETQLNREPVQEGMKILESRLGHTGHNLNPWFAIDPGNADEQHGRVWFGALAWSGNWRIAIEQTPYQQVRVTGGFNTFDFAYPLKPGESLETPVFYGGYSNSGFGEASRLLHQLELADIQPHGLKARARPVLYNSWEATEFNFTEAGQKELAEKAAKLAIELFVIDDGWFGKRNNDHAGLGDWVVNPQKFPNGLNALISYVNGLGMDFGLWVEPEMVNPDSDLYRAHPDWVMNFPGRPRSELRNQLVLNLARDDVKEYIFNVLDKLATEYKISYFKWDMNRTFAEPGWPEVAPEEQKELWVKYVRNLYDIMARLRAKHPNLEIESCSGGGGRIDLGILRYVDEFWTSDNTEAFDRLRIQEGFSQAYAPKLMSAWVTDVPNMNQRSTPLQYRFLVAMQGALGVGANLNKWTDEDTQLAAKMIALDKKIRDTVQFGKLYRILSPRTSDTTANEYVSRDGTEAVLFGFRHSQEYNTVPPIIYLEGLDAHATYRVESIDNKLPNQQQEASGAWLMQNGLQLQLKGDFDSTLVLLHRVQ